MSRKRQTLTVAWFVVLLCLTSFSLLLVGRAAVTTVASGRPVGTSASLRLATTQVAGAWYSFGPRGGEAHALAVAGYTVLAGGHREASIDGDQIGTGLYISANGGATWQRAGTGMETPAATAILDVAVSPAFAQDGIAFAATWDGLYRTSDGGLSWQRLAGGLPSAPAAMRLVALSPNFTDDQTVLAAGAFGGLYRSTNSGASWTAVPDAPRLWSLALSPDFANDGLVLAGGANGQIYRSSDRGLSWTTVYDPGGLSIVHDLAFSPNFTADGLAFAAAEGWGMLRSTDGGLTWQVLTDWPAGWQAQALALSPNFANDSTLVAGSDRGVLRSSDAGLTWSDFGLANQDVFVLRYATASGELLAGTFNGVYHRISPALNTTAETLGGWERSQGFAPLRTDSLAALRVADAGSEMASGSGGAPYLLFAGTELGVYFSGTEGLFWAPLTSGRGWGVSFAMPYLAVSADGSTLFAVWENQVRPGAHLYRSNDGGQNWRIVHSSADYSGLAISPAFAMDGTVLAGLAHGFIIRSTDRGKTWTPVQVAEDFELHGLYLSPDFPHDQMALATGFGPLYRSDDGGLSWQAVSTPHSPLYGLAFSPDFAHDGTIIASYRDIEGTGSEPEAGIIRSDDRGLTWRTANIGLPGWYEPFPGVLAASLNFTLDQTFYAGFQGSALMGPRTPYRSGNGGQSWLPLPTLPVDLAARAAVATGGQRSLHLATRQGVWHLDANCVDLIVNPGFERSEAWVIPDTMYWAGYSTAQAHSGSRSMRAGVPPGGPDVLSYSSFRQSIYLPPDVVTVTLRLWYFPLSAEGDLATAKTAPPPPRFLEPADVTPLSSDRQYVLILNEQNAILRTLMWQRSNAGQWLSAQYDLSEFAGQTVKVHMGVYNDGRDGVTTMYVDDVTVTACTAIQPLPTPLPTPAPPTPTVTPTPTPLPTAAIQRWLPLIVHGPAALAMPSPTFTPTATPSFPEDALVIDGHQASKVVGHRASSTIYALAGHMLYRSDDDGRNWNLVSGLLPAEDFLISPADPDWLWSGEGYPCYAGGEDRPLYRSIDGGQSWTSLPAGLNLKPLAVHPGDRNRLYARGCDGPYLSTDGGETWTHQPDNSPQSLWGIYLPVAVAPVGTDWQTVYVAGVSEGGAGAVIKSSDGGASWSRITPLDLSPDIWWITDLEVDWRDPGLVHFLDPHTPWWTTDGGQHWQWAWTGLHDVVYNPGGPPDQTYGLYDLAIAPGDSNRLYLGTIRGLYASPDGGLNWYKVSGHPWDWLPVHSLLLTQSRPDYLWLNTSAGVFGLDLAQLPPLPTLTPTSTPTPSPTPD